MLRKVLAIVGMLLTAPLFILGAKFLYLWARAGHGYAVRFDYSTEAATWLIWGGLTVLFLLGAAQSRKGGGAVLLLVGWASLVLFAIALPSHYVDPLERARTFSALELIPVQGGLDDFGKQHGHLPATQAELEQAFAQAELEKPAAPFVHDGKVLPYRPLYFGGALGPARSAPAGVAPGTILCAVNPELNHYWLTVTGLDKPVGGAVVLEENPMFEEGGTVMREGSLTPPPAAPPPPAKKAK